MISPHELEGGSQNQFNTNNCVNPFSDLVRPLGAVVSKSQARLDYPKVRDAFDAVIANHPKKVHTTHISYDSDVHDGLVRVRLDDDPDRTERMKAIESMSEQYGVDFRPVFRLGLLLAKKHNLEHDGWYTMYKSHGLTMHVDGDRDEPIDSDFYRALLNLGINRKVNFKLPKKELSLKLRTGQAYVFRPESVSHGTAVSYEYSIAIYTQGRTQSLN